ncbi:MAG: VOC family protein [Proteobacteria bacterium]|nr:VOC family protein [Pseudomonadota bacterium]
MSEPGWHHVHVVNPEWHEAANWHGEFSPVRNESWDHPGHQGYKAEVLRSGANLVLMQKMQHADPPATAWIDSLGFIVPDLDAALFRWQQGAGALLYRNPADAMATDPWGMRCEFIQGEGHGSALHHVNIIAQDPDLLLAWYQKHLGGSRAAWAWDDRRRALIYDSCQLVFSAASDHSGPDEGQPFRHFDHLGWFVEDVYQTSAAMMANGVRFPEHGLNGSPNPPTPQGPRTPAFAVDPAGIWFELVHCGKGGMQFAKLGRWQSQDQG